MIKPVSLMTLLILALILRPDAASADAILRLSLSGETTITAGEAWRLQVNTDGGIAGDTLEATLQNGLRRHDATLTLGSGGVAEWAFPLNTLTHAGRTLVTVRSVAAFAEFILIVEPDAPLSLDAFTTGHSLTAYGHASTLLITFSYDRFGNPVDDVDVTTELVYPMGQTRESIILNPHSGLAWQTITSADDAGIVRLNTANGNTQVDLTLQQHAGEPHTLSLNVTPPCVLADGIETITLNVRIHDDHGTPVNDGTHVVFDWGNGNGYGVVVDGLATLQRPAPTTPGIHIFSAITGQTEGMALLRVEDERCD